jgi:hypothetical protein
LVAFERKTKLEIQDSPGSGGIWITNTVRMTSPLSQNNFLIEVPVTNTYEVTSVMAQGAEQRMIAATSKQILYIHSKNHFFRFE